MKFQVVSWTNCETLEQAKQIGWPDRVKDFDKLKKQVINVKKNKNIPKWLKNFYSYFCVAYQGEGNEDEIAKALVVRIKETSEPFDFMDSDDLAEFCSGVSWEEFEEKGEKNEG